MDLEDKPFAGIVAAGNGQDGGREYLLSMIRSLAKLARRSREEEIAILLDAITAAMRAAERARR